MVAAAVINKRPIMGLMPLENYLTLASASQREAIIGGVSEEDKERFKKMEFVKGSLVANAIDF